MQYNRKLFLFIHTVEVEKIYTRSTSCSSPAKVDLFGKIKRGTNVAPAATIVIHPDKCGNFAESFLEE